MNGMAMWLDQLSHTERLTEVLSLGPAAQRSLWTLTSGGRLTLDSFVDPSTPPMQPVRHYGRNTLPVFKKFEKRFCRAPSNAESPGLWGYNEGSTRGVVGPGYFICRLTNGDERGDVVIDYTQIRLENPMLGQHFSPMSVAYLISSIPAWRISCVLSASTLRSAAPTRGVRRRITILSYAGKDDEPPLKALDQHLREVQTESLHIRQY